MLWGVKKTTPDMIAMAATLLIFACTPDQTFSDKTKGPSNIDWREHFTLYKHTVFRIPDDQRVNLFAWYDQHIFGTTVVNVPTLNALEQGHGEVDNLIEHLFQANLACTSQSSASPTAASPALAQPTTQPEPLPVHHISGDYP
ncbi:hypothetical protein EI94DRAFT_93827 [Lactarius quietus]|nr:hypothetical protein EI94DRAFT_93827 [Lactarius quietus]